jgi:hypothetical protein
MGKKNSQAVPLAEFTESEHVKIPVQAMIFQKRQRHWRHKQHGALLKFLMGESVGAIVPSSTWH